MSRAILPVVLCLSSLAAQGAGDASYKQLVAEHDKAAQSQSPEAAAAEFVPKFLAAAEQAKGTDAAVPYLSWVVLHGGFDGEKMKALRTLVQAHGKSAELGPVVDYLPHLATYVPDVLAVLDWAAKESPHPEVQARALFGRASLAFAKVEAGDQVLKAAREDLTNAAKLSKDQGLVARAQALSEGGCALTIGSVAPDIVGVDLDGAPFRLSDYRGKVVVLDFWGFW